MADQRVRPAAPLVLRLLQWSIGVVVLALATAVVYVLASGILIPHAPRTMVERQLATFEADVTADPKVPVAWAKYIDVLTYAGQYADAERTIERALKAVPKDQSGIIELSRVRLLFAQGRLDQALTASRVALSAIDKSVDVETKRLTDKGVTKSGIANMHLGDKERAAIYVMRARIYRERGAWSDVVDDATKALKLDPLAADVLTLRGMAYAKIGDVAAARKDLEAASKYGYAPAVEALKGLGR